MAASSSVLMLSIYFMMLSFASVQGYPSRPSHPSHPNAGNEDLLARIEQALGHPSRPSRPNAGYEDLLARIEQALGHPSRPSRPNAGYEDLLATIEQRPGFCSFAGLSPGCCVGNFCRTLTGCYCDSICRKYRDCCWDVPQQLQCNTAPQPTEPQPTEPQPTTAPAQNSCSEKSMNGGCCTGGFVACAVGSGLNTCHCNVECHSTNTCCHDIETINCFPQTCTQAGKAPGMCVGDCQVITSANGEGTCYCDSDCITRGPSGDCCDDVNALQLSGQDLDLLLLSELKKIEELAQLMESSHTYDWRDTRAENTRRRYQESLLGAQVQNKKDFE